MDLHREALPFGKRPALIVVDMINAFTDPDCPLGSACQSVVDANIQLLVAFRAQQLPVFFTTVVYHNDEQASVFRRRVPDLNCLRAHSHWVAIDPQLQRREEEVVIEKQWASAFFKTELEQRLAAAEADALVITGLTTSGCVRASVVDGLQCNYPVFVPRQAVGDRNDEAHKANLFDMHAKYADVVDTADIISLLGQL